MAKITVGYQSAFFEIPNEQAATRMHALNAPRRSTNKKTDLLYQISLPAMLRSCDP